MSKRFATLTSLFLLFVGSIALITTPLQSTWNRQSTTEGGLPGAALRNPSATSSSKLKINPELSAGSHLPLYVPPCPSLAPPSTPAAPPKCSSIVLPFHNHKNSAEPIQIRLQDGPAKPRHVFDAFFLNTELELLDVRLAELWNVVDTFIIMESSFTFSGKEKPLYFKEAQGRYKAFADKILHVSIASLEETVNDGLAAPNLGGEGDAWRREHLSEDLLLRKALHIARPHVGDLIIVSDLDELPRPDILHALKSCSGWESVHDPAASWDSKRFCMVSDFYYFSYEWFKPAEMWWHPDIHIWTGPGQVRGTSRGEGHSGNPSIPCVDHGAWHCSYAFPTLEHIRSKFQSFSHQELNTDRNKNPRWIIGSMLTGSAIWDEGEPGFTRIVPDPPAWIANNEECYKHLIDRRYGLLEPLWWEVGKWGPNVVGRPLTG